MGAKHFILRPGQSASATITCLDLPQASNVDSPEWMRKLLSVSFDSLCDWHILLHHDRLDILNNRVAAHPYVQRGWKHDDLPVGSLDDMLGVHQNLRVPVDYRDVTDRVLFKIDWLKRVLVGDPSNFRSSNAKYLDDVLNAAILMRFLEDIEGARGRIVPGSWKDAIAGSATPFHSALKHVFSTLHVTPPASVFDQSALKSLERHRSQSVISWLKGMYQDDQQGRYEYDFSLIAEHAIGQIYEKYISLVAYYTHNGEPSLFPEYDTELLWQKGTGSIYTPEFLARFLVNQVLQNFDQREWASLRAGDLACGSAVFLRNYLLKLQEDSEITGGITDRIFRQLVAIDRNPSAIAAMRLNLGMTAYKYMGKFPPIQRTRVCDTLVSAARPPRANSRLHLVLMNPPFKGYDRQSPSERRAVSSVLGDLAVGKSDYSLAFVRVAFDWLADGGAMGVVLPGSFVDSKSASKVRKLLANSGDIEFVSKFEQYDIFKRGETQIAVMVYRKGKRAHYRGTTKVLYCKGSADTALRAIETNRQSSGSQWEYFETDSRSWSEDWNLLPQQVQSTFNQLSSSHPVLSELFDIRQGIRIGLKAAFILGNYQHIPQKERPLLKPVADNDNVYGWRIHEDGRRIIYAYDIKSRNELTNSEMSDNYPTIFRHLQGFQKQLKSRSRAQGKPISSLMWPRDSRLMFAPKIAAVNFGIPGCYALDLTGRYAVTNGSFLVPRVPIIEQDEWYFYLAILNSEVFFRLLARRSRRLKGGQLDLDARWTKSIPVPRYSLAKPDLRDSLVQFARRMEMGTLRGLQSSEFETNVAQVFGLSPVDITVL